MRSERLLPRLEELAKKLGITIRSFRPVPGETQGHGGLCKVRGKPYLFVDSRATAREKVEVFLEALKAVEIKESEVEPDILTLLRRSKGT